MCRFERRLSLTTRAHTSLLSLALSSSNKCASQPWVELWSNSYKPEAFASCFLHAIGKIGLQRRSGVNVCVWESHSCSFHGHLSRRWSCARLDSKFANNSRAIPICAKKVIREDNLRQLKWRPMQVRHHMTKRRRRGRRRRGSRKIEKNNQEKKEKDCEWWTRKRRKGDKREERWDGDIVEKKRRRRKRE